MKVHYKTAGPGDLRLASTPRSPYSSKNDSGRVLIIGGSETFHGAPVMASNAAYSTISALRVGAGYAVTCVPNPILHEVRALTPNIIVKPLRGSALGPGDLTALRKEIYRADAIALGPGMGRAMPTIRTAAALISHAIKLQKRIVVDADAIRSIPLIKGALGRNVILTPHDGEFAQLSDAKLDKRDLSSRMSAAQSAAKMLNSVILLKGHDTVVTDGSSVKVIASKTAALATMGTGDVLSGIICGYAARCTNAFVAAVAGAYLHSRIGDQLYKEKGCHIIASDVAEKIPEMIKKFDRS